MNGHTRKCSGNTTEWSGSPARRKGVDGWMCDECGGFIPCESEEEINARVLGTRTKKEAA